MANPTVEVENRALRASMAVSAVTGVIGVAFALAAGSDAVLLDGVYSLISFGMAWVATRITRVILAPSTVHFPFGRAAFEPVVNTVRAAVILLVLAYAAVSAIGALSAGGAPARAGAAVVYGVLIGSVGLIMAVHQARLARASGSSLLALDAASWRADGAISLSVGIAFLIGLGLTWAGLEAAATYVDPVSVLVLVALLVAEPLGELRRALGELIVVAPPDQLQQEVFERVERATADLGCEDREIKLWKLGRHLTVRVTLLMPDGARAVRYQDLDDVRDRVRQALEGVAPALRVDVLFTADRQWLDARPDEA